ncbi:NADP oxidoreductase, partial [candidate division KSB1 bacterium]
MSKTQLATVWLDGCSGCHMSFLDMDERILELIQHADIVYSPLVDAKEFPEMVDIVIVEGAVSTNEDMEKIRKVRAHSRYLIALGDCAVTGNVPAMRNPFGVEATFQRAYFENAQTAPQKPTRGLPVLLEKVIPVHDVVVVDLHVPGCPPPADVIYGMLMDLIQGRTIESVAHTR